MGGTHGIYCPIPSEMGVEQPAIGVPISLEAAGVRMALAEPWNQVPRPSCAVAVGCTLELCPKRWR